MGIVQKIQKKPKGPLLVVASVIVWILFAVFLPGYTSSNSENLNILFESLFVIMTFLPFAGITYGIYSFFFGKNSSE